MNTYDKRVEERLARRYWLLDRIFHSVNACLRFVRPTNDRPDLAQGNFKRILLCNAGHYGDVILSTAAIARVRRTHPDAEIGFLGGTAAFEVLRQFPEVARVHVLNHWYHSSGNRFSSCFSYARARAQIVEELKRTGYDAAVDLRPWMPNYVSVLWRAGIPIRIGFDRRTLASLLTHPRRYSYDRRHEVETQIELVSALLGVGTSASQSPGLLNPAISEAGAEEVRHLLGPSRERVVVCHPGSRKSAKSWPTDAWHVLVRQLLAEGRTVVLTGQGARDAMLIALLAEHAPKAINACDQLSWAGFVELVRIADLVVATDTAAAHVAAATKTPCVVVASGIADPLKWRPLSTSAVVLTEPVSCLPCFRSSGCRSMDCIRRVSADEVLQSVHLLSRGPRHRDPRGSIVDD